MKAKALVIGNGNYPGSKLDNPENDAHDFGEVLKRLGFEVTVLLNIKTVEQDETIVEFAQNLDNYYIALFYFAGHGFQIKFENFLAAIDTNFNDPSHAEHSAFALNILLYHLNKSSTKTRIIILDACRELLNKKSWYRSIEDAGLAPMYAPKGTIIAFATSPGEKAADGTGRRNGIYTSALLQHIVAENIPIEEMFKRVRNTVYAVSKGKQISWEHTSLTGTFYFNSGQLSHSLSVEYNIQAIKDSMYEPNSTTPADIIIKELKSHNWYTQNAAMIRLKSISASIEDKNKLFLIGRNILQSACGGANSAVTFLQNLQDTIIQFKTGKKNHVLNGITYEMFFNSYGSFRQNEFKADFYEDIYKVIEDKSYTESLSFLIGVLQPYRESFFYIPSLNSAGISFDLVFESGSEADELKLLSIIYEGNEILIEQEYDEIWGISSESRYLVMKYRKLKKRIAVDLLIPTAKLVLNTNIPVEDEQTIKYLDNYKIMR